jgi:hypothetical protein
MEIDAGATAIDCSEVVGVINESTFNQNLPSKIGAETY